jgi:hypothetical protein
MICGLLPPVLVSVSLSPYSIVVLCSLIARRRGTLTSHRASILSPRTVTASGRKRKASAADLGEAGSRVPPPPEEREEEEEEGADCVVCLSPFEYAVRLDKCGHMFCKVSFSCLPPSVPRTVFALLSVV